MAGTSDRRGFVQRVRDARRVYKGPFSGEHVEKVVVESGYRLANEGDVDAFRVFQKDGCRPIPINPGWAEIWVGDPVFRYLQRDLDLSRQQLLILLNQARSSA